MTDGFSLTPGEPWRVTISRVGDGHVIHLHLGQVMVVLPALEAHKLGSALHAASGIDTDEVPLARMMGGTEPTCPACFGKGSVDIICELCTGSGTFDLSPAPGRHVTRTGKVLTDTDIQNLADEAERGYDVSHLTGTGHVDPDDPTFWHCQCGTRYGRAYTTCPACGRLRHEEDAP